MQNNHKLSTILSVRITNVKDPFPFLGYGYVSIKTKIQKKIFIFEMTA